MTSVQLYAVPIKPACMLRAKCQTGKILAIQWIQDGALFPSGIKIPDRKRRGKILALTTAGDASASFTVVVIAKPSAEKLTAPTTRAMINRSSVRPDGNSAW